ncbi:putative TIM-barrel fold metal-dependent hydrolase [Paraburkholderia sp. WSM4177]|nr:putative TIM-barrel fold metal-dependent hydrolase [Paraburkholderia sp. WSM4177]MBB5482963.1 putative TIM-barrel fold metal-dependent hydrolase [Paraburkholderia sp. WSM4180]
MVLANIAGRSLTDPMFAPIWAEIDRRALPVLVHPTDPPGVDLMDMTKFDLSWAVGFMFDTTLAITRMIFEGFFDQYPNLKLIASHAGGALPYLAGRFEKGNEVEIPQRRKMKRKPIDYLRHIYYDCITYSPASLEFLVSVVGADRVMFGTDRPHQVYDIRGAFANTARLPKEQRDAIAATTRCGSSGSDASHGGSEDLMRRDTLAILFSQRHLALAPRATTTAALARSAPPISTITST